MVQTDQKRIAKNTLILYVRMFFIMGITLYTSRVVLNALGVDDYGVYIAVGGFVSLFGIISNSLSAAISRFITYELGCGNSQKLKSIFTGAILIQIIIAGVIVLGVETVGVWFLNTRMTIPEGQMGMANWVLQFSVITFVVNLISVPYNAAIIAHERMSAFAYISIFDALGKLAIAFLILISPVSRLVTYAFLLCVLSVVTRMIYNVYCRRNFEECRFSPKYDRTIIKEIFSFAGWNFIGSSSGLLRDQGVNILLNIFCGPAVNAARGIAMQVSAAMQQFSGSFTTALNPQITKQYAIGDIDAWSSLVFKGARFSCYLLLFPSIPLFFEANTVLTWWLTIVPSYATIFVQLIIVYVFVETISGTLVTVMLATGNIRNYQLIVGGCQMLNFPIAYILLKMGMPPQSTIACAIIIAACCLVLRLIMLRRMVNLNLKSFFVTVVFRIVTVALISSLLPACMVLWMKATNARVALAIVVSVIWTAGVAFYLGCTSGERAAIIAQISKFKKQLHACKQE